MNATAETPLHPRLEGMPAWKRSIDLLCCALAMPVLALCVLVMTIITRLSSPGPVFFKQERVGHGGRRFMLYKFRTMHSGVDTSVHAKYFRQLMNSHAPMEKLDGRRDSRLIPGCWLLRASGLDELPQLINILQGEMSLVGPRPCIPSEYEAFQPDQRERVVSVPGLTGLWQVSGKNRTTFDEMIRLDILYGRQLSLWQDVRIILLTPWVLVVQMADTGRARREMVRAKRRPLAGTPSVPSSPAPYVRLNPSKDFQAQAAGK